MMNSKTIENYFDLSKNIPLALELSDVAELVEKQVFFAHKKSWWNIKKFLGLVSLVVIVTSLALFKNTAKINQEKAVKNKSETPVSLTPNGSNNQNTITTKNSPKTTAILFSDTIVETESKSFESSEKASEPRIMNDAIDEENNAPVWWPKEESQSGEGNFGEGSFEIEESVTELVADSIKKEVIDKIEGAQKNIVREIEIQDADWFKLSNSGGNLDLKTWSENKVKIEALVTIEARNTEVELIALDDFDLQLVNKKKVIEIESNWDSYKDANCSCNSFKNKIKTKNGDKIKVDKYKVQYTIYLPSDLNIDLRNSYGDITVPKMNNEVKVRVFKGNLRTGELLGNVDLSCKYSDFQLGNINAGRFYLYQSKGVVSEIGNLKMNAKYSEAILTSANQLDLYGFQSDVTVDSNVDSLKSVIKYGTLELKSKVRLADIQFFQAKLIGDVIEELTLSSSYSQLKANEINELIITKSFQDDFDLLQVGYIEGKGQYTKFKIEKLGVGMDLTTFQGKIVVKEVGLKFKNVGLNSKYTPIDLTFDPQCKYGAEINSTYADIKFPKEKFDLKYQNTQNQNTQIKGSYNSSITKSQSAVSITSFKGGINLN